MKTFCLFLLAGSLSAGGAGAVPSAEPGMAGPVFVNVSPSAEPQMANPVVVNVSPSAEADMPVLVVASDSVCCEDGGLYVPGDGAVSGDRFDASEPIVPYERFRVKQLVVPAVLVTAGQFGVWESHAIRVNNAVRDRFAQWRGDRYIHADDWLQYLPAASWLGLGAISGSSDHNFVERVIVLGTSYAAMGILVNGVKYTVRERRPDSSSRNSFPSGHTATAFMGAELIRLEYGNGYGAAAYAVATGIGVLRIWNDRHWLGDVLAGAGIGILSAEIGYWLLPYGRKLFGVKGKMTGPVLTFAPSYDPYVRAPGLALHFSL